MRDNCNGEARVPDKTIRILDHEITRRDAIKAGGLAGVGLAYAAPIVRSVKPLRAFAQGYAPSCATTTDFDDEFHDAGSGNVEICVTDPSRIASIVVTAAGGNRPDPQPSIGIQNCLGSSPSFTLSSGSSDVPFTFEPEDCPPSIGIEVGVFDGVSSIYEIEVTNCCGNSNSYTTPELFD